MTVFLRTLTLSRITALLAMAVMVFPPATSVARAQSPQPPYALFEYSALTGSGNTITATEVPVVLGPGHTIYVNLTMQFNVDSAGNLTLTPGYPKVIPAPQPLIMSFMTGKYVGPSTIYNGGMIVNVSGPGVTSGGATEWSLSAGSGAVIYTYPSSATWYVGPLASNPLAARLSKANITSTAWSYGLGSAPYGNGMWSTDTLIGVSQVGNTITIVSFTRNGVDSNIPFDQVTYTLGP
ncbi:MAG: hypothetical protein JO307_31255 [Bryobacterales bacterium]|nr:hypothetical protein [Bryobacterales bacterium]MBV9401989.1 hypothetical protein [Bryobacterales bacterium]